MMRKRTSLIAVAFALAVLLVSPIGMLAQVQAAGGDALAAPESCVICHDGVGEKKHQAIYDAYTDASSLQLTIDSVTSVSDGAGAFNATMTFTIMKDGAAYVDKDGLPSLEQKRFYAVTYDSATRQFDNSKSFSNPVALGNGQYTVTATGMTYDLTSSNGLAYAYVADGLLDTESGGHVHMYDDVASAGLAFGDVATYQSAANVSGCEKCHGKPYMKHGYRDPVVAGLSDFSSCKSCHYDTRTGGHEDWQILVDNPARFAEIHAGAELTADEEVQYAYKAKLMNDVHMAHAMEFPYPQSMSTCATCHEGKLDMILTDANFKLETCKSCHPVTGPEEGTDPHRAPALTAVMPHEIDLGDGDCGMCHKADDIGPVFSEIHTGYYSEVYDATGTPYTDIFQASVDNASLDGTTLTIEFSATKAVADNPIPLADMTPHVVLGLYGYDTRHMIVSGHNRDIDGERNLEFKVGSDTARMKTVSSATGAWVVTADLSYWADMITSGVVKRAEIAVLPAIKDAAGTTVAVKAPSRTFDLTTNAFDDTAIPDVVDFANCNKCHDALMPPNHAAYVGTVAGNMNVCRICHTPLNGASHLEMQSRSIDSYVHAIHSFQAFDIGDIDFADPVEAMRYSLHIEHVFPNFTIKNCEACHNEGMFDPPDQSKSLPGLLSGSDVVESWDRKIGAVPAYITGPASRACGGCHRAHSIKEDEASELLSFFQHTKQGGYLIEEGANTEETQGLLMAVIDYIMALFD